MSETLIIEMRKTLLVPKIQKLIDYFHNRERRSYDYGRCRGLAWNIKVYDRDSSCRRKEGEMEARGRNGWFRVKNVDVARMSDGREVHVCVSSSKPYVNAPPVLLTGSPEEIRRFCQKILIATGESNI